MNLNGYGTTFEAKTLSPLSYTQLLLTASVSHSAHLVESSLLSPCLSPCPQFPPVVPAALCVPVSLSPVETGAETQESEMKASQTLTPTQEIINTLDLSRFH